LIAGYTEDRVSSKDHQMKVCKAFPLLHVSAFHIACFHITGENKWNYSIIQKLTKTADPPFQ
jgi:hypothetical protein